MLEGLDFRDLLIADLAVARGLANPRDVAAALQRRWTGRPTEAVFVNELRRIAGLDEEALRPVAEEVDRLVRAAGGNARLVMSRRGGLDRSIHAALSTVAPRASRVLTQAGAKVRTALRPMPRERYVDFHVVGEGGMGVVFLALDTELNRLVAFKMVRPTGLATALGQGTPTPLEAKRPGEGTPGAGTFRELQARLLQEAWVTGGMEHPGIAPVYEMGQTPNGIAYYTMRFVRGHRTLAQAIEEVRGRPVEQRLALIDPFLKVCDTIRYAHAKGVVHRDLKPANIALGQYGEVVLLDWGLARVQDHDDDAGSAWKGRIREFRAAGGLNTLVGALGTPGYMSPEAAAGRIGEVDARSDVFSLGAILFEILTGRLPHEVRSPVDYARTVAEWDAPEARFVEPGVPAALSDVCARALARDRSRRPSSAAELADAIRAWQAESEAQREVDRILAEVRACLVELGAATDAALLEQVDRADALLSIVRGMGRSSPEMEALERHVRKAREQRLVGGDHKRRRRVWITVALVLVPLLGLLGFLAADAIQEGRRRQEREAAVQGRLEAARQALTVVRQVRSLEKEADGSWPLRPSWLPAMQKWLASAEDLVAARPSLAAALEQLAADELAAEPLETWRRDRNRLQRLRAGLPADAPEPDPGIRLIAARVSDPLAVGLDPSHEESVRAFRSIADALEEIDGLVTGRMRAMQRWVQVTAALEEDSLRQPADAWTRVIEEVGDATRSPQYRGLTFRPQLGLVPLGRDPASGLQEFGHLGSGEIPTRDPGTGALRLDATSAIVLVLIPPAETPGEAGSSAFFLGRTEVTEAQWRRLGGRAVAACDADPADRPSREEIPVRGIALEEARGLLERHRLGLPTEPQWTRAAQAAGRSPWPPASPGEAGRQANVADAVARRAGLDAPHGFLSGVSDGHALAAPVGRYAANPFGLHDMIGNLAEWCVAPTLASAGSSAGPSDTACGGSFRDDLAHCGPGARERLPKGSVRCSVGLRAAASIEGP